MKKFLLFTGNRYYPSGGWEDYRGEFDTVKEAVEKAMERDAVEYTYCGLCDWFQVVDADTRVCVYARTRKFSSDDEWYDPSGPASKEVNFMEELKNL